MSETLADVFAPKSPSPPESRRSIDEALVRQDVERQLREEYESKLDRLRTFTLEYLKRFTDAQHEVDTIELAQSQQRLGTIASFVSNSPKWVGGLEVERADRQIDALNRRLSDLGGQKTKSDPLIAQRKSTLTLELKEQRQLRKQLDDERREFEIRLRLSGDRGQSEYQRNQRLGEGQYVLMQYIGRGGFSEVWLAFDVIEIRNVALKIQRMNPQWSRAIKENFVRHSGREIKIMSWTHHENVVSFYRHFYIDDNTVVMVMEYCAGGDLAGVIRRRGRLPEKEARAILLQILQGLLALRSKDVAVIHYDLKPGNILFTEDGVVKITDFGLSKIVEIDEATFDLTSQGTGTYYYAAPETLQRGGGTIRVTQSVDTWSLGVIYYEMLYGQRPFGGEVTQQSYAMNVDSFVELAFPPNVKVTDGGKSFIKLCLNRDPTTRPVLGDLWRSEYLQGELR